MAGRSTTPARSKTPTRTQPSRGKTPTKEHEPSLSPAPSLPAPSGKPVVVSSSHIPFDPVAVWLAFEKDSDVVFATERHLKALCQNIGDHFQPYEHCNPLHFPPVARVYGLQRWVPTKLQSNRSRGPTCVLNGKLLKCHKSSLPAFLYSIPESDLCANATNRGLPTLVFSYRINKDGYLAPYSCWSCFSNGDSRCSIARTQFGKDDAILQAILGSIKDQPLLSLRQEGVEVVQGSESWLDQTGPRAVGEVSRQSNEISALEKSTTDVADGATSANNQLTDSSTEEEISGRAELKPPDAPRKAALARTAAAAGLDDVQFPRKMLLMSKRARDQPRLHGESSEIEPAKNDALAAESLENNPYQGAVESADGQTLFGKRVQSAPAPRIATLFRAAVATRAASHGQTRGWRDIVQDVQQRKADMEPKRLDTESPSSKNEADAGLLPPFREGHSSHRQSDTPRTPTPLPRSNPGHPTPSMTPRRFMDVDNISRGVLVAKQELGRIVANVRKALDIVEEADKAAQASLEETTTACSALKDNVKAERDLVHTFWLEREENVSNLESLKMELLQYQERLREKTAELDEVKDQLGFAETAMEQLYEQNQMTKQLWKDSVGKVKALEESASGYKDRLDAQREEVTRGQRREVILIEHKQALEAALLEASEENAALLARIARLEKVQPTSQPAVTSSALVPLMPVLDTSKPEQSNSIDGPRQPDPESAPATASEGSTAQPSAQLVAQSVPATSATEVAPTASQTGNTSASDSVGKEGGPSHPSWQLTSSDDRAKEGEKSVPGTWFE